jgi:hypothetical protein
MKEETLRVLPAIIYFFVAFSLIELTFGRMLERAGIHPAAFLETLIAAIVVGKVLIVVDHLPVVNVASGKPLIYRIIGKTAIYSFACFLVRATEHLVRYIIKYKSLSSAWEHTMSQEIWQLFLSIQVWYFLLFFIFVAVMEMIRRIGREEFYRLIFGK